MLVDDLAIRGLNRLYRKMDTATDVLSFPLADGPDDPFLGDVVISAERAREQAATLRHGFLRELAFLAVHGTLHLLGHDHGTEEDERRMFSLQDEVLAALGIGR